MASYRLHPKNNTEGRYEITVCLGYDVKRKENKKNQNSNY